jgi:hypothetical protein
MARVSLPAARHDPKRTSHSAQAASSQSRRYWLGRSAKRQISLVSRASQLVQLASASLHKICQEVRPDQDARLARRRMMVASSKRAQGVSNAASEQMRHSLSEAAIRETKTT